MSQSPRKLVTEFYEHFNTNDIDAAGRVGVD